MNRREKEIQKLKNLYSKFFQKFLEYRKLDPTNKHFVDTPERVVKMLLELSDGYELDYSDVLNKSFDEILNNDVSKYTYSNNFGILVVHKNIEFVSMCAHHLLPFWGKAHIGLLLTDELVGLSKVPRIVKNVFAKRLTVQEEMTMQISNALSTIKGCKGSIVVTEATHGCMRFRGVKSNSSSICSSVTGVFRTNEENIKEEFFSIVK